jgi:hypothetical protein
VTGEELAERVERLGALVQHHGEGREDVGRAGPARARSRAAPRRPPGNLRPRPDGGAQARAGSRPSRRGQRPACRPRRRARRRYAPSRARRRRRVGRGRFDRSALRPPRRHNTDPAELCLARLHVVGQRDGGHHLLDHLALFGELTAEVQVPFPKELIELFELREAHVLRRVPEGDEIVNLEHRDRTSFWNAADRAVENRLRP